MSAYEGRIAEALEGLRMEARMDRLDKIQADIDRQAEAREREAAHREKREVPRSAKEDYEAASAQVMDNLKEAFQEAALKEPKPIEDFKYRPSGSADQSFEPFDEGEAGWSIMPPLESAASANLGSLTSLPGEQVAIALIHLFETLWADMTPDQKETWLQWMMDDQKKWRDFWRMGETP